jgi:hypothetical protein
MPPILVALGAGASTTAGMVGMGQPSDVPHGTLGGLFDLLQRIAPGLLIVSIVLIGGAFALRRPVAVIPALLAGIVLYVSVHAQSDPVVMYAGMAAGYGTWIVLYLWTRRRRPRRTCAQEAATQRH